MLDAVAAGTPIRCWLKLDTGMHRLGIPAADAAAVAARLRALAVVDPDLVLMTHFARSDEFGERATPAPIACLESACQTSDARRVGKWCVRTFRSGWSPAH